MTKLSLFQCAAIAGALLFATQASAQTATAKQQIDGYAEMCVKQGANMPKPLGEWDLKGNPKLGKYCECFAPLFAARAMKAFEFMQKNPGKAPPGTAEQNNKEELGMRNTCRKQLGLPLAVDPA